MSGRLVGEVLGAAPSLKDRGLPRIAFAALVAIAEKAHQDTRQASVSWAHIRAGIYEHNSDRTAKRAVEQLKKAGLVRVVKRGFDNQNGRVCAPIYEIAVLSEYATQGGAFDGQNEHATHGGAFGAQGERAKSETERAESETERAKSETERATLGGALNGSTDGPNDGSIDGPRARENLPAVEQVPTIDAEIVSCGPGFADRQPSVISALFASRRHDNQSQPPRSAYQCTVCRDAGVVLNSDGRPGARVRICHHDGTWHVASESELTQIRHYAGGAS